MKNALSATTLRQIEAGQQEAPKAEPERGRPRQRRVGSERDKRKQADHREEKLGCRLEEDIDNDARYPERGRNPVKRQQPRANDIAADLRHRQKNIDRLSNEPQGSTCSKLRPGVRRKKQPPAHPRHRNRDAAHHYNEENSPADAGNRVANRIQARPSRNSDERGDPDQPGNRTGLLDHLRSDPTGYESPTSWRRARGALCTAPARVG